MVTFGSWLKFHRTKAGLTQIQVAERSGVSFSYVSTLERNQPHTITGRDIVPTRSRVEALAKAVNGNLNEALLAAGYAPATRSHVVNGFEIQLPDDVTAVIPYSDNINSQEDAEAFREAFMTAYLVVKERLAREKKSNGV